MDALFHITRGATRGRSNFIRNSVYTAIWNVKHAGPPTLVAPSFRKDLVKSRARSYRGFLVPVDEWGLVLPNPSGDDWMYEHPAPPVQDADDESLLQAAPAILKALVAMHWAIKEYRMYDEIPTKKLDEAGEAISEAFKTPGLIDLMHRLKLIRLPFSW